jgi:hypothetical protein
MNPPPPTTAAATDIPVNDINALVSQPSYLERRRAEEEARGQLAGAMTTPPANVNNALPTTTTTTASGGTSTGTGTSTCTGIIARFCPHLTKAACRASRGGAVHVDDSP